MTESEQRISIAEFCGWSGWAFGKGHPQHIPKNKRDGSNAEYPPDYLHDLNAMHEAEMTLDHAGRIIFINFLGIRIIKEHKPKIPDVTKCIHEWACHATATQRAEALLRTIRKWKE